MMQQPFGVYPQLPENALPTIGRAVHAYLEHLALRVEADDLSRDAFQNIHRNLARFERAWSVVTTDGRNWLVPQAEPTESVLPSGRRVKRRALKYGAATSAEAILQAGRLAEACKVGPLLGGSGTPRVRRNGERAISETGNDDLTRWLLANPQLAAGVSKENCLDHIVGAFAWFEDEYRVPSPYRAARLPRYVKKPRREARAAEYVALMRHGSRQLRRALWTLWNVQGIRPVSLRQMRWEDFNWEGGFVLTYQHKTARKTGKPLLIVMTPRQLRFFRNLHRQRPPWPEEVFLNTDGKPWTRNTFAQHVRRTARRLGLDDQTSERVSAYCFRHSFATQADEAGAAHEQISLVMGHSNQRMLREVYSKASQKVQHHRNAAMKIEKLRLEARRAERPKKPDRPKSEEYGELF